MRKPNQAKPKYVFSPIRYLSQYSSDLQKKYDVKRVRVAAVGLLKAGKSSFLSAMTQQPERFKSGVIRTTIKNQEYHDEFFSWIDTPGIDDTEQETTSAFAGLQKADVVLFVHNLKQGELDFSEMQFIQQNIDQDPNFLSKITFVLTHIDDVGDQAAAEIWQAIEKQCLDQLKHTPNHFAVSSPRYLKGIIEQKKLLIQRSNIPALQDFLLSFYYAQKVSDMQHHTQQLRSTLEHELFLLNEQQNILEQKLAF
jgi:tRNA U34 5-carboxymethylaminomethyl modifying GTPase MnmE/TrmE